MNARPEQTRRIILFYNTTVQNFTEFLKRTAIKIADYKHLNKLLITMFITMLLCLIYLYYIITNYYCPCNKQQNNINHKKQTNERTKSNQARPNA